MRVYVGVDPAASTGVCVITDVSCFFWEGRPADFARVGMLAGVPTGVSVHVAVERPFVGDNKLGAVSQAITAGALAERISGAMGLPFEEVRWLEPKTWRREIGCPMSRDAAKEWCHQRAHAVALANGQSLVTKRGRKMIDAAEAWGIAEALKRIVERSPDAGGEPE